MIDVQIDTSDLKKFGEQMKKFEADLKDMSPVFFNFNKYMKGEIGRRVRNSFDPERGPFLGILYTSRKGLIHKGVRHETKAVGVNRTTKQEKRFFRGRIRQEKLRAPLSLARPLQPSDNRSAALTSFSADKDTLWIHPVMRSKDGDSSIIFFHHRPEISGHPRTKGYMPDRSFFYLIAGDVEKAEKYTLESVNKKMNEDIR